MTARIRWTDSRNSPGDPAFTGSTGDLHSLFKIWPPEDPGDEWLLTSPLPGMEGERCYGFPDDLKGEAEHWLTRFASSIGANFPEACDYRKLADKVIGLFNPPDNGQPEVDQIMHSLDVAADFITDQQCFCQPPDLPCFRCSALGQYKRERVQS